MPDNGKTTRALCDAQIDQFIHDGYLVLVLHSYLDVFCGVKGYKVAV